MAAPSPLEPRIQRDELTRLARLADRLRRLRRARTLVSPQLASLFGEPAWDIMLDIFSADVTGRPLSVSSACIGAGVPTSTGLRWLVKLERHGTVRRRMDPTDARRSHLSLEPAAFAEMVALLRAATVLLSPSSER